MYRAYISRASSGDTDNGPVIDAILALRQEQARLAGFNNAALYFMANKVLRPSSSAPSYFHSVCAVIDYGDHLLPSTFAHIRMSCLDSCTIFCFVLCMKSEKLECLGTMERGFTFHVYYVPCIWKTNCMRV